MFEVLLVVYLLVALGLIGLVLIQQGKGADMGASFGSGASNTVFGSGGAGNFLTRTTAVLAIGFFVLSLLLGNLTANRDKEASEWETLEGQAIEAPVLESEVPASEVPSSDVPASAEDGNDVPAS